MDPETLSNVGRDIQRHFTKLASLLRLDKTPRPGDDLRPLDLDDIRAEEQRFQLWAANLGLNGSGDRSLEYRLQEAPSVKEYTLDLLQEFRDDLSQSVLIYSFSSQRCLTDLKTSWRSLIRQAPISLRG